VALKPWHRRFARGPRFALPRRRATRQRVLPARPATVGASVIVALIASLATACSTAPAANAPHGIPSDYGNAPAQAAATRFAQYGLGANATYRLCADDCPGPTAKRWAMGTPFAAVSPALRDETGATSAPATDAHETPATTRAAQRIAEALSHQLRRHAPGGISDPVKPLVRGRAPAGAAQASESASPPP
jgi:hypothetical protein